MIYFCEITTKLEDFYCNNYNSDVEKVQKILVAKKFMKNYLFVAFIFISKLCQAQNELGINYSTGTVKGVSLNFENYPDKNKSFFCGLAYNYSVRAEESTPIQFLTEHIKTYEFRFEMRRHFDTKMYFTKFYLGGGIYADYANSNQDALGGYKLTGLGGGFSVGGGMKVFLSKRLILTPNISFRKPFYYYNSSNEEITINRMNFDRLLSISLSYRFGIDPRSYVSPKFDEQSKGN